MAVNIVILGSPGAGKGTQAEQLARVRGVPKISTGDVLREAVRTETELGRSAKAIMDRGALVSDEIMIEIIRRRLARDDVRPGFVLDGFPRTLPQAEALDAMMVGHDPIIVLDIMVSSEEVVRRLGARHVCGQCEATFGDEASTAVCTRCGGELVRRSDDLESVVRERLKVYARDTAPLRRRYRDRSTFAEIDGAGPRDVVALAVAAAVDRLQGAASPEQAGRVSQ
jgi:adenylate kinase